MVRRARVLHYSERLRAGAVPEGLKDRSQAIYCLEQRKPGDPSRRDGMIGWLRWPLIRGTKARYGSYRSLRDGSPFYTDTRQ
jgi:hypothetical protein